MVLSVGSKKYCAQCGVFGKKKVPSVGVLGGGGGAPMGGGGGGAGGPPLGGGGGGGAPVVAPLGEGVHEWCFSYFQM